MLPENVKSKQYYLDKMSLFMRNSYGIEEQVELFWQMLTDIDTTVDTLFNTLSLNEDIDVDHTLDIIAEIVGCKRNLSVTYQSGGSPVTETLFLTNKELIRFIKTRVLQNNYDGSYEMFKKNYNNLGLYILAIDLAPGEVQQILNEDSEISENDEKMFLSGNYTIRSLGIKYSFSKGSLDIIGFWDNISRTWDNTIWGD